MPLARAADGAALFWSDTPGAEADADAPTALWLHGLGRDGAYFAHAPRWLPRWRHVLVDLRGFGRSPAASGGAAAPRARSLQLWADDVAAVLHAARGDGARVLLVGHSFGAAVAVQLAASRPDAVAALALAAPSARVGDAARAHWAAEAASAEARGDVGFAAAASALAAGYDLRPALAAMDGTPLLLLAGARDALTPPRAAEGVARAAPRAAVTLRIVPNAGHDALRDEPQAQAALAAWAQDAAAPAICSPPGPARATSRL